MALVVNKADHQQVEASNFSAGRAEQTTIKAKFTGETVHIPDDCFLKSNHYIKTTNGLLEGKKLRKFWYIRYMWRLYALYCIICIFAWVHLGFALGVFIGSLLLFLLSCQYVKVSCISLRCVKKQPVIDGLSSLNEFVEVDVKRLSAEYAVARDAGYGRLCAESGKIEFQVFSPRAIQHMNSAQRRSVTMLILCVLQMIWASVWTYNAAVNNGSVVATLKWGSD